LPMQSNRLLSPLVLCLPRQLAPVFFVHLCYLGTRTEKSTLICRINSAFTILAVSWPKPLRRVFQLRVFQKCVPDVC
jgi:hypothetical protein